MNELEVLAVGVHAAETAIHGRGAVVGRLSEREQGAAIALHLLGIVHHVIHRNAVDVAAHVGGIAAALCSSRIAHLIVAGYDLQATVRHARRI